MRDPTFDGACRLQLRELREGYGCSLCVHRDKNVTVFGKSLCGREFMPNKDGYCWRWAIDLGASHPRR